MKAIPTLQNEYKQHGNRRPREALQRANDFEGTIHLLITDVVMPELNGPELAEQIASLRPGIKVIFTSGYASETIARRG